MLKECIRKRNINPDIVFFSTQGKGSDCKSVEDSSTCLMKKLCHGLQMNRGEKEGDVLAVGGRGQKSSTQRLKSCGENNLRRPQGSGVLEM